MGLFSAIGNIGRGIFNGVSRGVRGLGNLVTLDWDRDMLRDLGAGLGVAAPFIPGGALLTGGLGALGGLMQGGNAQSTIMGGLGALTGRSGMQNLRGGIGNIASLLRGGGAGNPGLSSILRQAPGILAGGAQGPGGVNMPAITSMLSGGVPAPGGPGDLLGNPSFLQRAGNWISSLFDGGGGGGGGGQGGGGGMPGLMQLGGLLLGGNEILNMRDRRNEANKFNADRMRMLQEAMTKSEALFDEKAGMRTGGINRITELLGKPGYFTSQLGG